MYRCVCASIDACACVCVLPCAWCWEALRKAVRAGIITKAPPIPTNEPKIPATTPAHTTTQDTP